MVIASYSVSSNGTDCFVESEPGSVIAVVYAGSGYDPWSDLGFHRGVTD